MKSNRFFQIIVILAIFVWSGVAVYYFTTYRQAPTIETQVSTSLRPQTPTLINEQIIDTDTLLEQTFPAKEYLIVERSSIDLETFEETQNGKTVVAKLEGILVEKDEFGGFWKVFKSTSGKMGKVIGVSVHQATAFYQKISGSSQVKSIFPEDFKEQNTIEVYYILSKVPPDGGAILILK